MHWIRGSFIDDVHAPFTCLLFMFENNNKPWVSSVISIKTFDIFCKLFADNSNYRTLSKLKTVERTLNVWQAHYCEMISEMACLFVRSSTTPFMDTYSNRTHGSNVVILYLSSTTYVLPSTHCSYDRRAVVKRTPQWLSPQSAHIHLYSDHLNVITSC